MLGKLAELVLFGMAPMFFGGLLLPDAAVAEEIAIAGEATYRERIALPPGAVLTVRLADVSRADAPAPIVAERKVEPAGQVPIRFELKVDAAALRPRADYAVQARITVDDQLWFVADQRHSVDPRKPLPLTIVLRKVDRKGDAGVSRLFGRTWLAEDIEGRGVIDDAQSTFRVEADGKVSGGGGCNRYFAQAKVEGESIRIEKSGATMMACAPALMDQERKFLAALGRAATFRVDDRGQLFMANAQGADILRFSAAG